MKLCSIPAGHPHHAADQQADVTCYSQPLCKSTHVVAYSLWYRRTSCEKGSLIKASRSRARGADCGLAAWKSSSGETCHTC